MQNYQVQIWGRNFQIPARANGRKTALSICVKLPAVSPAAAEEVALARVRALPELNADLHNRAEDPPLLFAAVTEYNGELSGEIETSPLIFHTEEDHAIGLDLSDLLSDDDLL